MNMLLATCAIAAVIFASTAQAKDEQVHGLGSAQSAGEACSAARDQARQACVGDGTIVHYDSCKQCEQPDDRGIYNCTVLAMCHTPETKPPVTLQ